MTNLTFTKEEQTAFAQNKIGGVILFGSRALGNASQKSDYDVFIIGKKSEKNYDLLYDLLSKKINQLTNIDIVFDSETPMELKNHVAHHGIVLYQSNPNIFPDFKQHVMLIYADFAPHRKIFQDATLNRITP